MAGPASAGAARQGSGHDESIAASASVPVSFSVNGTTRELVVESRMTLADVLRDLLGMRGTKIGCNRGACSACTVWLDGAPVCSCMLLAVDASGCSVTTIEGLAGEGAGGEQGEQGLHPLQAAFIEHDAVQCGFCTPGLLMSCAALLREQPGATAEEIRTAIGGHLCRCGTYPHVVAAALAAARDLKK